MTPDQAQAFWLHDDNQGELSPPATPIMMAEFSHRTGLALPEAFVTLYRYQNGGYSSRHGDSFWAIDAPAVPLTTLDQLCDGYHDPETVNLWTSQIGDLSQVVVFLGDGHYYFGLNYHDIQDHEPVVWYFDDNRATRTGMTFERWLGSDGGAR